MRRFVMLCVLVILVGTLLAPSVGRVLPMIYLSIDRLDGAMARAKASWTHGAKYPAGFFGSSSISEESYRSTEEIIRAGAEPVARIATGPTIEQVVEGMGQDPGEVVEPAISSPHSQ